MSQARHSGFSLIEIIIAVSLFGLVVLASGTYTGFSLASLAEHGRQSQANTLAYEAFSIVRMLASDNWESLNYQQSALRYWNNQWSLVGESSIETIGNFNRQLVFETVCRDVNQLVVDCNQGLPDAGSKKLTVLISWSGWFGLKQIKYSSYVTNWR